MKNINFPLLLGSIIVILLILVTFYPGIFTSNDPLFEESPKYIEYKEDGVWKEVFAHNPIPPNKENILGTDDAGRDVYARLIYGTRNTLKLALLIAIFRMTLALPLGLAAGMGVRFISNMIRIVNTYFTAIPMLLFSFIVLNIGYFRMLQMDKSILAFGIVLGFVGWAKLAGMIEDSSRRVMEEDFIEGEIAIGKTKLQIAYQNLLPHIIPTSISLFFKEMGLALFLIAQLAVLYVFVGVTRQIKALAFKANYDMILEPEWGGTLSRIATNIRRYDAVYWITLYPIIAFSIAIIGINLTGEGLRMEFQKRESRVISSIRKGYYHISPRMFISQIKNIKKYYKPVIIKASIIIGIIALILIPWHPSQYQFDLDLARLHLEELTKVQYEGRVTGTEGGYLAGEYIINTLKAYGYEVDTMEIPLTIDGGSIPHIMAPVVIESGRIKLKDENGEEKTYHLHQDFTIPTINEKVLLETMIETSYNKSINADSLVTFNLSEGDAYFLNESNFYGFRVSGFNTPNQTVVGANNELQFILLEGYNRNSNTYLFKSTTIIPFDDLRLKLEKGYKEIEISFTYPKLPKYQGRNITAFLPGKGKTIDEPGELIIIGVSYDGVHINGTASPYVMSATPAAMTLEAARVLSLIGEPLEKSVQFIFWDNEYEDLIYSPLAGSYHYGLTEKVPIKMALSQGYYYLDISYPGLLEEKILNLVTYPAQRADKSNYLMGLELEKRLKQMDVKYRRFHYDYISTNGMRHMKLNALTSIGIGNPSTWAINSTMDTFESINYKRMESIGQAIIDTLTMNPYIME